MKSVILVLSLFIGMCQLITAKPHSWSYEGQLGPENWGDLDPDYEIAKTGKRQSPIDLNADSAITSQLARIEFNYEASPLSVVNNGHTFQVNNRSNSHILIEGQRYNLLQYHFHIPSEHTVEGEYYPMEMHFVHQNAAGELAVVGVFLDEGLHNPVLQKAWDYLSAKEGTLNDPQTLINPIDLLPFQAKFASMLVRYQYNGSLTTPPCSEGVLWLVLKKPIEVSKEQIDLFESIFEMNARPVQPHNQRFLLESK